MSQVSVQRLLFILFCISLLQATGLTAQQDANAAALERRGKIAYNEGSRAFKAEQFQLAADSLIIADSLIGGSGLVDRELLRVTIGEALDKAGKSKKALEYYRMVKSGNPGYPFIEIRIARAQTDAGQLAAAIESYSEAFKSAPDSDRPAILNNIVGLYHRLGNTDSAIEVLGRAISISSDPAFLVQRGTLLSRKASAVDQGGNEDFDFEAAVRDSTFKVEELQKALELRKKAASDFEQAAGKGATNAKELLEREQLLIKNTEMLISEIHFFEENNE